MGPATTLHMFLGCIVGWGVLSPLAKWRGWAPGEVGDWNEGSKGWIVWVSLAIMLADAGVSLGWLILRPGWRVGKRAVNKWRDDGLSGLMQRKAGRGWSPVDLNDDDDRHEGDGDGNTSSGKRNDSGSARRDAAYGNDDDDDDDKEYDAPASHLISNRTTLIGLVLSLAFCTLAVQLSFPNIISTGLTLLALLLALLLSIMGVRALGETDLNPVSGISKLTQLVFALLTSRNNPNAIVINMLAGAISESGALQAGDLLQDLKTGHLLGASPKAQFYGQLIGSAVGAVVSAVVYKLYTRVYTIPGGLFQVPTAYVWVFTARLVTGGNLPPHAPAYAGGAAVLFAVLTALRIYGTAKKAAWTAYVPGGIAVAVGMYNTPSFTLARTLGGLLSWWWIRWRRGKETPLIVLASGLILGEGLFSIVNLGLASGGVGHL